MLHQTTENRTWKQVVLSRQFNRSDVALFKSLFQDIGTLTELSIDLTHLDFAGTDFVNTLFELTRIYRSDIHKLVLQNPNESIVELLEMTGLHLILNIESAKTYDCQTSKAA